MKVKSDQIIILLTLGAGFLMVLSRIFAPLIIGWDQGIQLEAAHRLLSGLGLTSIHVGTPNLDLFLPPEPRLLTHFPPAYSLVAAALIGMGIPLEMALKGLYALITLVGWFGWGWILVEPLRAPVKLGGYAIPINWVIALSLPLFFTPVWQGTDIILWAALPFWVWWMSRQGVGSLLIAGGIMGFLATVRYASLFLVVAALIGIFASNEFNFKRGLRQFAVYFGGSCLFLIPLFIYNRWALQNTVLPSYVSGESLSDLWGTITRVFSSFSATSFQFGLPIITSRLLPAIAPNEPINTVFGILSVLTLAILPLIVIRTQSLAGSGLRSSISLWLGWLPISLVVFLTTAMFANRFNFLTETRYYWAAQFIFIVLVYGWLSRENPSQKGILTALKFGIIALLAAYHVGYRSLVLVAGDNNIRAQQILGISDQPTATYPSQQIFGSGLRPEVIEKIAQLRQSSENPVFFLQNYSVMGYRGLEPKVFRPISGNPFWEQAFTSQDMSAYFIVFSRACPKVCDTGNDSEIPLLSKLPLELVFTESYQQQPLGLVRIYRVPLKANSKIQELAS